MAFVGHRSPLLHPTWVRTRLRKAPATVPEGAFDWPRSPLHCDKQWLQPGSCYVAAQQESLLAFKAREGVPPQ